MKVAIVTGLCVPHDAVSDAVRHQRAALVAAGHDVMVFAHSGTALAPAEVVETADPWWMHHHPDYRDADLVILHHGIYYELFDALVLDHPRAVRVVHFHNITPPRLLTGGARRAAVAGFDQLALAGRANAAWCDSAHNAEVLCRHADVHPDDVTVMPLCVPSVEAAPTPGGTERRGIVAVGRLVEAKGLEVLVRAYAALDGGVRANHPLRLIGRRSEAEAGFPGRLAELADGLGVGAQVAIEEGLDDDGLTEAYRSVALFVSASRHEGFCVPVIEALAAGCSVVVTDAGALPDTVGDFGEVVPVDDPTALTGVMSSVLLAGPTGRTDELEGHLEPHRPSSWAPALVEASEALVGTAPDVTLAGRLARRVSASAESAETAG